MTLATEILDNKMQKLFADLQDRGGYSDAKKYKPLLKTGLVRSHHHLQSDYVVSHDHPQYTVLFRIPAFSKEHMADPDKKNQLNAIHKFVVNWFIGNKVVTTDAVTIARLFFKRHTCLFSSLSVPEFLRQELVGQLDDFKIPYVQVSIDHKKVECPRCTEGNEVPQDQTIVFCSGCGAEFSS